MNTDDLLQDQIQIQAVEVQCPQPTDAELALYTYETSDVPNQCCPSVTRTACLMDGTTVPVSLPVTSHQSLSNLANVSLPSFLPLSMYHYPGHKQVTSPRTLRLLATGVYCEWFNLTGGCSAGV